MCLNGSYRALVAFWFRCFFIVLFLAHFGFRFFRFTASTATTSATCCCCDFLLFRLVAEIFIRCWRWFFFFGCWTTATSTATCTARSTTSSKPCTFLSGIRITRTTRWIVLYWKIFYLVPTQISLDKIQFHLKNQFKWLKKNDFRLNFFKNQFKFFQKSFLLKLTSEPLSDSSLRRLAGFFATAFSSSSELLEYSTYAEVSAIIKIERK